MILVDEGGGGGGGGDGGGQKGKQQHHSGKFEFQTDEDAPLLSNGNNHQKPSPFIARLRYEGETRGGRKGGRKGQREREGGSSEGKQHHSGKFEFQTDEDAPLLSNGNNHQKPSPFVA